MPSKKSKPSRKSSQPQPRASGPWKAESACSERELEQLAAALARELAPGDRVLLEGPMGAGKTTFSRKLLECLGVRQPPEGSPSFALAHEYLTQDRKEVVHVDFYRIRGEEEIAEAGIEAYFWERQAIVIAEWTSLWPEFEAAVLRGADRRCWRVALDFVEGREDRRRLSIRRPAVARA